MRKTPAASGAWKYINKAVTYVVWGAPEDGDDADFRVIGAHDPFSD